MNTDILNFLPDMSRLKARLKGIEKELQNEFGHPITLTAQRLGNDHAIDCIVKIVSDVMDVPINQILSSTRGAREASDARAVAIYLCNWFIEGLKDVELAKFFSRNHGSIASAIGTVEDLLSAKDKAITDAVELCSGVIKSRINNDSYAKENRVRKEQ